MSVAIRIFKIDWDEPLSINSATRTTGCKALL